MYIFMAKDNAVCLCVCVRVAQGEAARSEMEHATQQLLRMQDEVEEEAAARFRAEDALNALRAAVA
jgi:hypothetical protein